MRHTMKQHQQAEQQSLFGDPPPATRAVVAQDERKPPEQSISTEARTDAHSESERNDRAHELLEMFVAGR